MEAENNVVETTQDTTQETTNKDIEKNKNEIIQMLKKTGREGT